MVVVGDRECGHDRYPQQYRRSGLLCHLPYLLVDIGGNLPHLFCAFLAAERKALSKDLHFH
jgi:hypothetical protein